MLHNIFSAHNTHTKLPVIIIHDSVRWSHNFELIHFFQLVYRLLLNYIMQILSKVLTPKLKQFAFLSLKLVQTSQRNLLLHHKIRNLTSCQYFLPSVKPLSRFIVQAAPFSTGQ